MNTIVKAIQRLLKLSVHFDFVSLFFVKEGIELSGKKNKNLIIITLILLTTYLAIGFANGSLDYLGKKMNDPFINFINIPIKSSKADKIGQIQYELNKDTVLKNNYDYKSALGFNKVYLSFQKYNKKTSTSGSKLATGRTIDLKDPLLDQVFSLDNLLRGRRFKHEMDLGLIVTVDFLEKNNYSLKDAYLPHSFPIDPVNNIDTISPLPVIAVVKELPGMNDFLVTPYFNSQRNLSSGNPFNPNYTKDIIFYSSKSDEEIKSIVDGLKQLLNSSEDLKAFDPEIDLIENSESYISGKSITINFLPQPEKQIISSFLTSAKVKSFIGQNELCQIFDYKIDANQSYTKYDVLSIHFNSLNNIREFKEFIGKKHGLEIDMAKIEALENYNFITKITRIISLLLIGFSILSICLFVGNLLTKHLDKIHVNIGTFKAFGLDDKTIMNIYILLIYFFIISSMVISFIMSLILGELGIPRLFLSIFNLKLEENQTYFNLFDTWTFISTLLTLVISFFVLYFNTKKMLKRSPGDLIYSRDY